MASIRRPCALQAAATVALAAAPIYWFQGRRVRRRTPRLEEAPGKRSGVWVGSKPAIRIVGLGESPIAAVGLASQSQGVLPCLAATVASESGRQTQWQTAAKSGATVRFTTENLLPQVDVGPTDLVVVSLGVNDCLTLRSARRWRQDLQQLLHAIRQRLEPRRIVVTGIPPMQHFPALPVPLSSMLGLRASLLNAATQRFADFNADLLYAPMNFVERPDNLFCCDGFHPNATAHEAWARQLASLVDIDLL